MTIQKLVPLFYFPLKVLFVDDNVEILKLYERNFSSKFNVEVFNSPEKILQIINAEQSEEYNLISDMTKDYFDSTYVGFDIKSIVAIIKNAERFNKIGVLVTDHDMPEMNGLTLCRQILNPSIKRILLTGNFMQEEAIKALNDGIINCYVEKSSNLAMIDIERYISLFMQRYFTELTQNILDTIGNNKLTILSNLEFIKLFNELLLQYKIREYYILNSIGSFLLIADNKKYVFNVHNDESLNEFCSFFAHDLEVASLIEDVKNRQSIPFFGLELDPVEVALNEWQKNFYPATVTDNFFWNIIEI